MQGVGFRAETLRAARRLGLSGWVRNRDDGAVEAEAQGPEPAVAEFAHWIASGPSWARVERVEAAAADVLPAGGFEIVERRRSERDRYGARHRDEG